MGGTADTLLRGLPRWPLVAVTAALAAIVFGKALWPVVAEAIDPQQAAVTGVVFEDRNGNGARDAGERGIRGVTVTDGVAFTETGDDGSYALDLDTARRTTDLVYITKPAGWSVPKDEFSTPRFYRDLGQLPDGQSAEADFAMVRDERGRDDDFTFANVADPHRNGNMVGQMQSINASSKRLAFIQVSGDLTDNATDAEFGQYKTGTAASQLPVWPAVGNHEYRPGATYDLRIDNYRRHVGPEWYSFGHGDRHFLVIDNNGAAPFDEQFAWVERDLAEHARGKRVVVLMHQPMNVPFGSPSQYDAFEELLERYETELILVGHEHSNDVDEKTFVRGAKHIQTNSSSYTIDHSPRGFRWVEMRGDRLENPFRMYGVNRSLVVTNPGPGGEAHDELQVSAYHTSDEVDEVRYRVDGRGSWRDLRRSGDFTWHRDDLDVSRGTHELEVVAIGESGERWSETTTFVERTSRRPDIDAGADWTQFHGDAAHSGIASDLLGRDLGLAWSHRADGVMLTGSPAIADGVVYAGTRDENGEGDSAVRAVDLETGRERWEFDTPSSVHGTPAVGNGMVYVPTLRGTLYAVDARSGRLRWKVEPEPPEPPLNIRSYSYYSPAVADGKVLWAYQTRHGKASRGLLTALDPRTGAMLWEAPMTGATMSDGTPAVADGRVYVGNETADRVIAYDLATGAQLWTAPARLGGWQDAAPTAVGGRVFIGSNNRVIARDAVTGADLWTHQSPGPSWIPQNATASAPAVVGDTLYMGFPDGRVTALNVATGAVVWTVNLPGQAYLGGVLSPPAVSGDTVWIGSNNGHLYGLDRATGAQVWSYEIGSWVASGPAISGNALVAGAWDGNLYAFASE